MFTFARASILSLFRARFGGRARTMLACACLCYFRLEVKDFMYAVIVCCHTLAPVFPRGEGTATRRQPRTPASPCKGPLLILQSAWVLERISMTTSSLRTQISSSKPSCRVSSEVERRKQFGKFTVPQIVLLSMKLPLCFYLSEIFFHRKFTHRSVALMPKRYCSIDSAYRSRILT